MVAGGLPRMVIHGTLGSWLKYGLDAQEAQLIRGVVPGNPGWGEDPRPGFFHEGWKTKPSNCPCPKETSANTISAFAMRLLIRHPIR